MGRGGLGRRPAQENMLSREFKELFCFWKGSGFQAASLPPLPACGLRDPFTTCCKSIVPPPRKSLWPRGGEGREAEAGKGQHPLFPKDVIHSQMSFPAARCHTASCPLNPGISSLHMTQSDETKNREHEPVCARVCPPVHICGPRSSVHSLIPSMNISWACALFQ